VPKPDATSIHLRQSSIQGNSETYIRRFELVPEFKAAIHIGEVTTGEIGIIKKDIVFSGDVLNTTARIQSLCNSLQAKLLVSEDLLHRLDLNEKFISRPKGEIELRGKENKVRLFEITRVEEQGSWEKELGERGN